jgi:hypothetical protein
MKAIIAWTGGRAPPSQNRHLPCAVFVGNTAKGVGRCSAYLVELSFKGRIDASSYLLLDLVAFLARFLE